MAIPDIEVDTRRELLVSGDCRQRMPWKLIMRGKAMGINGKGEEGMHSENGCRRYARKKSNKCSDAQNRRPRETKQCDIVRGGVNLTCSLAAAARWTDVATLLWKRG